MNNMNEIMHMMMNGISVAALTIIAAAVSMMALKPMRASRKAAKLKSRLDNHKWNIICLEYSVKPTGKFKDFPENFVLNTHKNIARDINIIITPYCKETHGYITLACIKVTKNNQKTRLAEESKKAHKIIVWWDMAHNSLDFIEKKAGT